MAKKEAKKPVKIAEGKDAKKAALQQCLAKIEKDFGRGAVMRLGDEKVEDVDVIPTGSIGLNYALGVGGFPVAVSSKSMAPSHRARPRLQFMP